MSEFTWIPFYKELAEKLLAYRNRQGELIAILKSIKDQGLPMILLTDKDKKGKEIPLRAIDPFTFFASFNRKATDQNRQAILAVIRQQLQMQTADAHLVPDLRAGADRIDAAAGGQSLKVRRTE